MQKVSDSLLILSPEEREAAQKYIGQRLRSLDADQASQIQELIQCAKRQAQHLQADRERLRSGTTTAAKIMQKLTVAALSGLSSLVAECNRAVHVAAGVKTGPVGGATEPAGGTTGPAGGMAGAAEDATVSGAETETDEALAVFLLNSTPDEDAHAASHIEGRLDGLDLNGLELFRDACREQLTWWESERGQTEGLHIEQYGDPRSAAGRVTIRQKRDELGQRVLNPFKKFYGAWAAEPIRAAETRSDRGGPMPARQRAPCRLG